MTKCKNRISNTSTWKTLRQIGTWGSVMTSATFAKVTSIVKYSTEDARLKSISSMLETASRRCKYLKRTTFNQRPFTTTHIRAILWYLGLSLTRQSLLKEWSEPYTSLRYCGLMKYARKRSAPAWKNRCIRRWSEESKKSSNRRKSAKTNWRKLMLVCLSGEKDFLIIGLTSK